MSVDRRRLLVSLAAGGVAARVLPFSLPAAAGAPTPAAAAAPLRHADGSVDWSAVRAEFDGLDPDWTHLSGFLFVSQRRRLRQVIERFRAKLDSDPYWIELAVYDGLEGRPFEAARTAMARFLGGRPEEIAFTSNTTSALAMAYHGLRIRADQEIVTTEHDHMVHHESIRYACDRSGARVRHVALWDRPAAAEAGEIVRRLERAIGPKTRALGVTWVYSSTGAKLPIAAIAEVVARANRGRAEADRCLLIVDGVHGFGNQDVDVAKLGADLFATATHKWFHGPRGTGLLWGKKEIWPQLRPTVPSFDPLANGPWEAWMERRALGATEASWVSPGGFLPYENFFALPEAVSFFDEVGRDRIAARIAELNGALRDGLAAIPGVTLHTPRDPQLAAGINCFEVRGVAARAVQDRLAEKRVRATASPYAVSYARLSAGIMNSPADVERALAAVRDLARKA